MGAVLSIVLLFVMLVLALALRDNIARNFGPNSAKRERLEDSLGVFDDDDDDIEPVRPSTDLLDNSMHPPPEDDSALAVRTGFTGDQIQRLHDLAQGTLSQFCALDEESLEWSIPVRGVRIDEPAAGIRDARDAIASDPLFTQCAAFIVSDALGHEDKAAGIAVIPSPDPLEPFRMVPSNPNDEHFVPLDLLELFEEWQDEAPFTIVWAAPNGLEVVFQPENPNLSDIIPDFKDLCPDAFRDQGAESGLESRIGDGIPILLWWP